MPLPRRTIFYFLFALSGFTGLIYESIWTHYLKLFLGHAAYAQTLVLAIFMGGLALGSWLCSKYSVRWDNLLKGYAIIEGIIGLSALVFHNLFELATQFSYSGIIPHLGSPVTIDMFKWTLSALLIFPQTILLGMTFPLMTAGLIRMFPEDSGRSVSMLYFTNSLGAALGVLTSGFVLIRLAGLPGTIRIAGFINIGLGIYVWLLVRGFSAESLKSEPIVSVAKDSADRRWYWFLLAASGITGAASFMYEIGWIRMLALVLGSSTHAFELMLSAFVFGLAFGGLWMRQRIDRISNSIAFLVNVQIIMGLLALLTLPLYGNTFLAMEWLMKVLPTTNGGYALFNLASGGLAMLLMVPTTFFAGMTLPLITLSLIQRGYGEKSIGAVYAVNTVGAIAGVFFAVHVGMPMLGLKGLMIVGAGLDIMLGLALLRTAASASLSRLSRVLVPMLSVAGIVIITFFVKLDVFKMASGVYRTGAIIPKDSSGLLFHKDGKTATVTVLSDGAARNIRTNGKVDAEIQMDSSLIASSDELTMVLLAALPLSIHPQARQVAAIGFGAGLTTATYLHSSTVAGVDTVEIEPMMVEGAQKFRPIVEKAYADPRSRIYIEDAKTFFSSHGKKYDIIVSEPSNPWVSGVSGLFSKEFYHFIGGHLNQEGIFCQWLQLYEIDNNLVASVLKALSESFSEYVIYALDNANLIIIARNGTELPAPVFPAADNPELAKALKRIDVKSIDDFRLRKMGDRRFFRKFIETFPIQANSDYNPVLDQNAARTRFLHLDAVGFTGFAFKPLPIAEMLENKPRLRTVTEATPTPYYEGSLAGYAAMGLRDYYTRGSFPEEYADISADIRAKALEVKNLFFTRCSAGSDERIAQMYEVVAVRMIPFLSPKELDTVWAKLESGTCMSSFTDRDRQWIALLKAIGARNATGMSGLAEALLEKERTLPKGPVSYLTASGMLGYLMQADREHSLALWNKYRQNIYGQTEPSFFFRMLAAQSTVD